MVATIVKAILAALTGLANAILPLFKYQFHAPEKRPPSLRVVFFLCLKIEINL